MYAYTIHISYICIQCKNKEQDFKYMLDTLQEKSCECALTKITLLLTHHLHVGQYTNKSHTVIR